MVPATPRGFRDVLPGEAACRERIIAQVQALFAEWGYDPVETPTLESVASLAAGHALATTPFRFFDVDGNQLALRPDVTLPVARLAATRMRDVPRPLRLRYTAPVFREEESLRGLAREFTQLGVESIGMAGAAADAEVAALLVEALYATGLTSFTVDVATVSVLAELVRAACDDAAWREQVLVAYHQSNWVRLAELTARPDVRPAFGAALRQLPRVAGGPEAVDACRALVAPLGCDKGLDQLEETLSILGSAGVLGFVRVDFSIMNSLDYYTGLVMQAYAPGIARPLGSGGRYDGTLAAFGKDEPAAGFAFGLESVMAALPSEAVAADVAHAPIDAVVGADTPGLAFKAAAELRARGLRTRIVADPAASVTEAAEACGAASAWRADDEGRPVEVSAPASAACTAEQASLAPAADERGGEAR